MPVYEKKLKEHDQILLDLQAIDPGITEAKMDGTFLIVRTRNSLEQSTLDLLLAYSPFTFELERDEDVAPIKSSAQLAIDTAADSAAAADAAAEADPPA